MEVKDFSLKDNEILTAKDLELGDWVYNEKNEICKVHSISQIFDSNIHLDNYSKPNDGTFEFAFEVYPIPLTEDIFNKNFSDDIISWRSVDYPTKLFVIIYTEEGTDANDVIITIEYVHELQHLLRLLKIEKKIVLDFLIDNNN